MIRMLILFLRYWLVGILTMVSTATIAKEKAPTSQSVFDFTLPAIDGSEFPLSAYRGKVLVLVNTATGCGFASQFEGMQKLWETYRDQNVVVISMPSNDFGEQEPLSGDALKKHCEVTYGLTFPITGKIHVRDKTKAHKLFQWIAETYGEDKLPGWNFSKYVFDKNGKLVESFSSITGPGSSGMKTAIEKALATSE